jgi:hypothetical protein
VGSGVYLIPEDAEAQSELVARIVGDTLLGAR